MTRAKRQIFGSLQSRFLAIYLVVMTPIAILASYYQFTLAETRFDKHEQSTLDSVARSFIDITSTLHQSTRILDQIFAIAEQNLEPAVECRLIKEAVARAPFTVIAAGISAGEPNETCFAGSTFFDFSTIGSSGTQRQTAEDAQILIDNRGVHDLRISRRVDQRVVFISFDPGDPQLPPWVRSYRFVNVSEKSDTPPNDPKIPITPWLEQPEARGFIQTDRGDHLAVLPQNAFGLRVFATISGEILRPPLASRILKASVAPLLVLAVAMLIADLLVRRLVLRDINLLTNEMRAFLQDRHLPQTDRTPSVTSETASMRAEFSNLARQLLHEEAEAENRIHNANTLQREIFHRVGNNLQILQSILRLQASNIDSEAEAALIKQITVRLRIISLVHDVLHRTVDAPSLPVGAGIHQLVQRFRSEGIVSESINIFETYDDLDLKVNQVYTLMYLVSELLVQISNSNARRLQITVKADEKQAQLYISAPLPTGLKPDSVGERLCAVYARGLKAETHWNLTGDESAFTAVFTTAKNLES